MQTYKANEIKDKFLKNYLKNWEKDHEGGEYCLALSNKENEIKTHKKGYKVVMQLQDQTTKEYYILICTKNPSPRPQNELDIFITEDEINGWIPVK